MLKTLVAFAVSRNLAKEGERLSGRFDPSVSVSELLSRYESWQLPLGLYFTQMLGHNIRIENSIALAPLTSTTANELVGILTRFQGIEVGLLAIGAPVTKEFERMYRPGLLRFKVGRRTHQILLSWLDMHKHGDIEYTMEFG